MAFDDKVSTKKKDFSTPILLTIIICVVEWNQQEIGDSLYKWTRGGFINIMFLRLMMILEPRVASKIGTDFRGKLAKICLKHIIIPLQYLSYVVLCVWTFISIAQLVSPSEKDQLFQLPQGGQNWWFLMFMGICIAEVIDFIDSCADKHIAAATQSHADCLHISDIISFATALMNRFQICRCQIGLPVTKPLQKS